MDGFWVDSLLFPCDSVHSGGSDVGSSSGSCGSCGTASVFLSVLVFGGD